MNNKDHDLIGDHKNYDLSHGADQPSTDTDSDDPFVSFPRSFFQYGPRGFSLLILVFAIATSYHESNPGYAAGLLIGISFLFGAFQWRRTLHPRHINVKTTSVCILCLAGYLFLGTAWSLYRLPIELETKDIPEIHLKKLQQCYETEAPASCYLEQPYIRDRIFAIITFWPLNILHFLARDPIRAILEAILRHTEEIFHKNIVAALERRFQ